ncbi:MAG TPA: hypothetical protein VJ720_05440, partial [Chitinophaga sp.]|nr:hypothetical protein [Chitinophaga sp.]
MDNLIIQVTSGRGPAECTRVVARVVELMMKDAKTAGIEITVLESKKGDLKGTLLSALLKAKGANLESFIREWKGTVQWIAESPYRKFHKRKNWFVGVEVFDMKEQLKWN